MSASPERAISRRPAALIRTAAPAATVAPVRSRPFTTAPHAAPPTPSRPGQRVPNGSPPRGDSSRREGPVSGSGHIAVGAPVHSRSLVPFVTMCVAIVAGSLVSVLLLNTTMESRAYQSRDLESTLAQLTEQRAVYLTSIEEKGSPARLAGAASDLGMVPAGAFGFITIATGAVTPPGASG